MQEVPLEFQPYIPGPPVSTRQLYQTACAADGETVNMWRETWIRNFKANKKRFGNFADHSIGKLYKRFKNEPCIVAGSGPSLKFNVGKLKTRGDMGLVSCLHNFHYMEDNDARVDVYTSLDAGKVTVSEVSEGGQRSAEEYWDLTRDKTLACYVSTDPELLEKWQGEILFYNCPVPDNAVDKAFDDEEPFNTYVSCGGNVLGASMYIAKVFMGANPIIFVGADFSFGYEISKSTGQPKFHAWDSKYDQGVGQGMTVTDIFGNKVKTWPSYWSFKCFFDRTVIEVPGIWINATEGGIFGAYSEGNIAHLKQMTLDQVIEMYSIADKPLYEAQALRPRETNKIVCF
jgi:hypothetical protein